MSWNSAGFVTLDILVSSCTWFNSAETFGIIIFWLKSMNESTVLYWREVVMSNISLEMPMINVEVTILLLGVLCCHRGFFWL